MDKQTFISYLQYYQEFSLAIRRIEKALGGDNLLGRVELFQTDWYAAVDAMLDTFLSTSFTEDGLDIIYNNVFSPIEDFDIHEGGERLWNELISDKESYFK